MISTDAADMHTMRLECGTVGNRFYRFKMATTGYCEMEFRMTEGPFWSLATPFGVPYAPAGLRLNGRLADGKDRAGWP
jgi:hypothetical protein